MIYKILNSENKMGTKWGIKQTQSQVSIIKQWPCRLQAADAAWRKDQLSRWNPWASDPDRDERCTISGGGQNSCYDLLNNQTETLHKSGRMSHTDLTSNTNKTVMEIIRYIGCSPFSTGVRILSRYFQPLYSGQWNTHDAHQTWVYLRVFCAIPQCNAVTDLREDNAEIFRRLLVFSIQKVWHQNSCFM